MDTQDNILNMKLFDHTQKGEWDEVVKIYKRDPQKASSAQITKMKDTALHIAVATGKIDIALKILDVLDKTERLENIVNEEGNTPLHFAAQQGERRVCQKVKDMKDHTITTVQNKKGESAIFLAARHDKEGAFLILHSMLGQDEYLLRRLNGDTVFHVALANEYFRMAMTILDLHPRFADYVNVKGVTPLHILAGKPNAFRSSTPLGYFDTLLYHCVVVDIEPEGVETNDKDNRIEKIAQNYPENCRTCVFFVVKLFDFIMLCIFGKREKNDKAGDVENPNKKTDHIQPTGFDASSSTKIGLDGYSSGSSSTTIGGDAEPKPEKLDGSSITTIGGDAKPKPETTTDQGEKMESYPSIYASWVLFFKSLEKILRAAIYASWVLFFKILLLGTGIWRINEIKKKKEKHIRAKAIMNKLVTKNMTYVGGAKPSDDKHYDLPDPNNTNDDLPNPNLTDPNNTNASTKSKDDLPNPNNTISPKKTISIWRRKEIKINKQIHKQVKAIMNELVKNASGAAPRDKHHDIPNPAKKTICSPILIAAKTGAAEMVEKILKELPVAIFDLDEKRKNVVLLAIENRQPHVYEFLLNLNDIPKETVFGQLDAKGNSALHLAATQCEDQRPWLIAGSALQMQWEIKWYEFVKTSMPPDFFAQSNHNQKTPTTIFLESHKELIKEGREWLGKTSESCSVVAALVATVAFATSATVPGGVMEGKGHPTFGDRPGFSVFTIASLAALCFSVTALVFFLSILTSRYQEEDFAEDLPRKLLLGLTFLFSSIVAMLVSFCAGHLFILKYELRYVAYPLYALLCFPISFFALAQLSLYLDLVMAIFYKVPQRSYDRFQH